MSDKPVVLFDADGFLLDFHSAAFAVANRILGTNHKVEDCKTWNMFDTFGREHEDAVYAELNKPGFCADHIQPYPGSVHFMEEAQKLADVVIVTSPMHSATWCEERVRSLQCYFNVPRRNVIFTSRKDLVCGRMLVDDRPVHVFDWHKKWNPFTNRGIIWDQPYNRTSDSAAVSVNSKSDVHIVAAMQDPISDSRMRRVLRCFSYDQLLAYIDHDFNYIVF